MLLTPEAELPGLRMKRNVFYGRSETATEDGKNTWLGDVAFLRSGIRLRDEPHRAGGVLETPQFEIPIEDLLSHVLVTGTTDSLGLRLDVLVNNPVLRETYAGKYTYFLSGISSGTASVAEHARAIGVRVSTPLGHFDVSLDDDSSLGHLHLNEAIAHSFEPSIRAMEQLRLDQLNRPRLTDNIASLVESHLPPGVFAVCVPIGAVKHLAEFEQSCLHLVDQHGILLTAKRVDYLFGSQYIEGTAVNFPLVGGFANVISKAELDVDVTAEDWVKLGSDAFLIACIAFVPVGGSVAAIAASGAVIGGVHSGLTQGALTYVRTGDTAQALHSAGRASIEGATIGAVGGAVAGKALQSFGTSFRGVVASGSLAGGAVGATDATFRIVHDGSSVSEAVSEILTSAGKGALTGGALGGAHYGISHFAGRLETVAGSNIALRQCGRTLFDEDRRHPRLSEA